jgi:hypothetical protein
LDRSNVKSAKCIVILPRDLNDAESDATSHTLASLISRLIDPSKTRLVVRLVSEENYWMFEDHVSVVTGEIADLLLVQEAADPGVSKSIRKLLMNTEACDPMVFKIEKFHGKSWGDLINACLLRNMGQPVNKLVYPLALNTNWSQPIEQVLRIGDSVMVASSENHDWKAFEEELLKHAPRNFDTVLNQFLQ